MRRCVASRQSAQSCCLRLAVFTSSCTTEPSSDRPHRSKPSLRGGSLCWAYDQIVFEDRAVGVWLGPYIAQKSLLQIVRMWRRAQRSMLDELKSTVRAEYPLEDAKRAVKEYLGHMTGGKVLLKPS